MVERTVSQCLMHLRIIERALHDHRPLWSMRLGQIDVPVEIEHTDRGVTFTAEFDEHCWMERPVDLCLLWDGDVVSTRPVEPSDAGQVVHWSFTISTPALAA